MSSGDEAEAFRQVAIAITTEKAEQEIFVMDMIILGFPGQGRLSVTQHIELHGAWLRSNM
jgi:hypothetical protein